jgi:hypothetical protein
VRDVQGTELGRWLSTVTAAQLSAPAPVPAAQGAALLVVLPGNLPVGHAWKPGAVSVSCVKCRCVPGEEDHLRVSCRVDGCPSCWYQQAHQAGTEVTGRPGFIGASWTAAPRRDRRA